jgi:hypothetical protein
MVRVGEAEEVKVLAVTHEGVPHRSPADTDAFGLLQHQAMAVGQRRVELRLKLAALEARECLTTAW